MLVSKQPKQQTHPIESSYFSGKIECNSQEAISLQGHVYGVNKGGLSDTPRRDILGSAVSYRSHAGT